MSDKEKIKELEEKIAYYEGLPTANFYTKVLIGIDYITTQLETGKLDFDSDPFAKSVFTLAKDCDKIFNALGKGIAVFSQADQDESKIKKLKKATAQVAV